MHNNAFDKSSRTLCHKATRRRGWEKLFEAQVPVYAAPGQLRAITIFIKNFMLGRSDINSRQWRKRQARKLSRGTP